MKKRIALRWIQFTGEINKGVWGYTGGGVSVNPGCSSNLRCELLARDMSAWVKLLDFLW